MDRALIAPESAVFDPERFSRDIVVSKPVLSRRPRNAVDCCRMLKTDQLPTSGVFWELGIGNWKLTEAALKQMLLCRSHSAGSSAQSVHLAAIWETPVPT
jgi:hypothetical protein